MKKIYLISIFSTLIIFLLSFTSCGEDQDMTISDQEKDNVPENVELLEYSDKSITVAWDFIKGATSYTVQLVDGADSDYPLQYYTTSTEDFYEFSKLDKYSSYYARVRANFLYSATSDWMYIMNGEQRARIMPRSGIVDQGEVLEDVRLINSSTSTLTLSWSFMCFDSPDEEYDNNYEIVLYEDEACENLVISWSLLNNKTTSIFTVSGVDKPQPLRFTFTGLNPGKTYYFKAKDLTRDKVSSKYACGTLPALPVASTQPKENGDIILSQDFANFIHGGDILYTAAGYSLTERGEWIKASGQNPVKEDLGLATYNQSVEFNVFDGGKVTSAYTEAAGMKGWGKSGNTSTRPGYIKIGGGSAVATLYTPELNPLSTNSTVTIKFKTAIYKEGSNKFCEDIIVRSVEDATFSAKGAINNEKMINISNEQLVSIVDADGDFKEYKVVFKNVTPKSRISFGSNESKKGQNKTRFLLDDIVIEVGEN